MEYIYLFFLSIVIFILAFLYQRLLVSNAKTFTKILPIFIFILIVAISSFLNPRTAVKENILNPVGEVVKSQAEPDIKSEELEKIIQSELEDTNGTYAVAIKNLKTDEYYYYNENREFDSASLYKLWVMGAVFKEIEKGNLSLDQNIGFDATTINERLDIASESAEISEGFVGNTVGGAIDRMITVSDNYSAHILYLTIGWSKVGDFIEEYNLSNSSTDTMTTTALDTANYFEKLYRGEIVNQNYSNQMIEILKKQELSDRIPKYLPEETIVAHKTGELGAVKHNAGIVYSPTGDYIIVLMSETDSQTTAAETEAKISEKVWDYFKK